MGKTLKEIAQELSTPKTIGPIKKNGAEDIKPVPKVQLIYAFNGVGKTRLSRAFKALMVERTASGEIDAEIADLRFMGIKTLYYNALTEDLFYWDNDLANDLKPRLRIQPNSFTDWVLRVQGQDINVITMFQRYAKEKLTPQFNFDFSEVTFSFERGNNDLEHNIKISKGEESIFIWSVFLALVEEMISELNILDNADRSTDVFNNFKYVFIDDPVSSLDENHLIELAVNLASLIKTCNSDLKFIIATHNPLFYNVLYNELNSKSCYMLVSYEDGTYALIQKAGDSNKSFSYHLHLKQTIEEAILNNQVERYHFALLRNLYEKTASFLGYPHWSDLLPDNRQLYLHRILNFTSHNTLSNEAVAEPSQAEKATVKLLLDHLKSNFNYYIKEQKND